MGASELSAVTVCHSTEAFVERRSASDPPRKSAQSGPHPGEFRKKYAFETLRLPVEVSLVRTRSQLDRAIGVRYHGYEKFHPEMAPELSAPEFSDSTENSVVFLATEKLTGAAVGSLRIETNIGTDSFLTRNYVLPSDLAESTNAWVTRLSVLKGPHQQISKLALFKALHRYCLALQIDWIIAGAVPPMDRLYLRLGFCDVFDKGHLLPLAGHPHEKVRLLKLNTLDASTQWKAARNPLYPFMFQSYLPDIRIFSSVSNRSARSRWIDSEPDVPLAPVV